MANLIPLEQAAAILGISAEALAEMRSNNQIFGYRDGMSWKFKMTELERVADEMGIDLDPNASAPETTEKIVDKADASHQSEDDFEFEDLMGDEDMVDGKNPDSDNLLPDDDSSSGEFISDSADDLIMDSGDDLFSRPLGAADSGIKLDDDGDDIVESAGDVTEDGEEALSFGSSDISLAAESSKKLTGSGTGEDLLDDELSASGSPSDTGKMAGDDDLLMSEDDLFSDELSLADSGSFEDSAELSSDFEDSDLIMDDSDSSTEIVLEANDSGINLSPNESGISLGDEPLELGGSDIDSLELPEDDDDIIMLEDPADPEQATMMQEDDFNLTPLEEAMDDESTGSQVIALEDSEIYTDESSATILAESAELGSEPAMLDDSMGLGGGMDDPYAGGLAPVGAPAAASGPAALPEAPYSLGMILGLGSVTALLGVGGMVAYDLARNLWMPPEQVVNSGILKFFLDLVGMG